MTEIQAGSQPKAAMGEASSGVGHDHLRCINDALAQAERLCASRGARLTPLRRRVLELVWTSHQPRGAYAILDLLAGEGRSPAPLTAYRALEFLEGQGLVHRIESLNAFIGCAAPETRHSGQFLVCDTCGNAEETNDPRIAAALAACAEDSGFQIARPTVEIHGRCRVCRAAGREAAAGKGAEGKAEEGRSEAGGTTGLGLPALASAERAGAPCAAPLP